MRFLQRLEFALMQCDVRLQSLVDQVVLCDSPPLALDRLLKLTLPLNVRRNR